MKVAKRTFEAMKHPKGSPERDALNQDALTSEYMTSYKYCVRNDDGSKSNLFCRTKAQALEMASNLKGA